MLLLSTTDNPYNPWLHWDEWYAWDEQHGYHLCSYLATLANYSESMNEEDQALLLEETTQEIIEINLYGNIIGVPDPNLDKEDK